MAVTAQHFTEFANGRQQTTDGLWLHRGPLWIRESNATSPVFQVEPGSTTSRQQLAIGNDTIPRIYNGAYMDAHLRLDQTAPSEPRIGFHEAGSTALTLYKQTGSNDVLRVRSQLGADYALAGAPQSGQKLLGSYFAAPLWTTPSLGVWHETPIVVTTGVSGKMIRIEASLGMSGNTVGAYGLVGIGWGGTAQHALAVGHVITPDYLLPYSFTFYHTPTAGVMRYAVFVQANYAGTFTIWNGIYSVLYVTEQYI